MFSPFLSATAVATTFVQLGAMPVPISWLTLALQAMSIAFPVAAITVVTLSRRGRHKHMVSLTSIHHRY